ncbi:MAG: DNA recombination protein RmuC [Acidimicrobiia bacterium]
MDMTVEMIALIVVGGLVGLGLIALAVALKGRARAVSNTRTATPEVDTMAELKTLLAGREGAMEEKVSQLDSKLAALQESVTSRESALSAQFAGIGSQMKTITGLFTNDRQRGNWGEISMARIFEHGGLVEDRDFTTQFDGGGRRPDAVVHIPGGCDVVIDSKFPQARYLEALECEDDHARNRLLQAQGTELEAVGKNLIKKDYADLASGGYVVMYLPSQAVYEAAIAAHPEVLERLMEVNVIVAGPNALFAVLMNIGSLMKEHRAIQQADEILAQAKELQVRMGTFVGHLRGVGQSLGRTVSAFNGVVGSWTGRVSPALTRIGELRGEDIDAEIIPIDESVRELPAAEHPPSLRAANR